MVYGATVLGITEQHEGSTYSNPSNTIPSLNFFAIHIRFNGSSCGLKRLASEFALLEQTQSSAFRLIHSPMYPTRTCNDAELFSAMLLNVFDMPGFT